MDLPRRAAGWLYPSPVKDDKNKSMTQLLTIIFVRTLAATRTSTFGWQLLNGLGFPIKQLLAEFQI